MGNKDLDKKRPRISSSGTDTESIEAAQDGAYIKMTLTEYRSFLLRLTAIEHNTKIREERILNLEARLDEAQVELQALKGLWHASAHVRHLDFCSGGRFFKFTVGEKISFHRPLSASELRWNLVQRILDHIWAILVVYMCIFLKIHWEIGCRREKVRGEVYEAARDGSCFRLGAGWYPKEERKRQRNSGMRITDGYLWREMFMTAGGKWSVCVCIRQTKPSLNIFCPWRCDGERGKSLQFYPFNIISFLPP